MGELSVLVRCLRIICLPCTHDVCRAECDKRGRESRKQVDDNRERKPKVGECEPREDKRENVVLKGQNIKKVVKNIEGSN